MCMINAQIRDDVKKVAVYVIRYMLSDEIRSPYRSYHTWQENKKQTSSHTRKDIELELKCNKNKLWGGVFHSFKNLDDAIDQLHEDFGFVGSDLTAYPIYSAVATGVIGDGINSDDRDCWFSTELELKRIIYRSEE